MDNGYFVLWRKITNNPIFHDNELLGIWLKLLLLVRFKPGKITKGNKTIDVGIGEYVTSVRGLSEHLNIPRSTLQRKLKIFEDENMIAVEVGHLYTKISVIKYEAYMNEYLNMGHEWDTSGTRVGHKEVKELKKVKRERFVPPTVEDIKSYCQEKNLIINYEKFVDHYISNGWKVGKNKMVDWKAAVRNWAREDSNYGGKDSTGHMPTVKQYEWDGEEKSG